MSGIFAVSFFAPTSGPFVYEVGEEQGEREVPKHISTPDAVRAVYITSWVAGTPSMREKLLDFVRGSEINSVVIDIKDYTGNVAFLTGDPAVEAMKSEENRIPDIHALVRELHASTIYVIGRIAVFQDPHAARRVPAIAVADIGGGVWKDRKGLSFIDPASEEYWAYIARIAHASAEVGFDEINFDYIRYPSDGVMARASYAQKEVGSREAILEEFFKYLRAQNFGVPTSADLFGLTTWTDDDLGVGQVLERAAPYFDYIAPMVYPSHYERGFQDFANPAEHPYEVINASLLYAKFRLEKIGEDPQKIRPWIQDFDLGADYGVREIEAQKQAVYDAGLDSWMSWDPSNIYTKEAYRKQQ